MSQVTSLIRKLRSRRSRTTWEKKTLQERQQAATTNFAEATAAGCPSIYWTGEPTDCNQLSTPLSTTTSPVQLRSSLCTEHQLGCPAFRYWAQQIRQDWCLHRKLWEFCFVLQALYERDMLRQGRRGLGFAVGSEPLPDLMASLGCQIMATDLDAQDSRSQVWEATGQLAAGLQGLNVRQICPPELFSQRVSFRAVDMNHIPADLREFDFSWSSCSFEHCGSIELGARFLREQMKCLKPGGVAVHTTEYNLSSVSQTISRGTTVIFRRGDIEQLIRQLQADGHSVEPLQLDPGNSTDDFAIDFFPYSDEPHLKLELFGQYISTSVALIIRKAA